MTKKARNYNQDHFKVGGSAQPGDELVQGEDKQKLGQQSDRSRKVPPGAPGTGTDGD
jgi:hypothetical protein